MKYAPGEWYGLVTGEGCVILAPESSAEKVLDLWASLCGDEGFSSAVQHLMSGTSLASLPDFAIVIMEDACAHVAVRGPLCVRGTTTQGPVSIKGGAVMTWREETVSDIVSLVVSADDTPADKVLWPLNDGVARVSMVDIVGSDSEESDKDVQTPSIVEAPFVVEPAVQPAPVEAEPPSIVGLPFDVESPEAAPPPPEVILPLPDVDLPTRDAALLEAGSPTPDMVPPPPDTVQPVADAVPPAPAPVPPPPPPPPAPEAQPPAAEDQHTGETTLMEEDYTDTTTTDDDMHSTTYYRSYFTDDSAQEAAPSQPPAQSQPTPGPVSPVSQDDDDDHDGMTVMSWSGLETGQPADDDDHDGMTVMALPEDDDHDGMTVMEVPGMPGYPGTPPPPPPPPPDAAPLVLARICRNCRTPNSTRRVACRSCGAPLTGEAVQIPRPALGAIKLPDGRIVPLDHPLVIGRRPEATRFSNSDIPVLVSVDDPHVSSTHLKIDLEDWSVLVTSLGRNGTILRRQGQPDRRFTEGEQVIAQVGDIYMLSSDLSVTVMELA